MDETLSSIKKAEEAAAELRREAVDKAAAVIERARAEAAAAEADATKKREDRRREKLLKAESDGKDLFAASAKESGAKAQAYADKALGGAEATVLKIVGRITRGDC